MDEWRNNDLLHVMSGSSTSYYEKSISFLFPLLLQEWSFRNYDIPIACQLQLIYNADANLEDNSEEYMEQIMYHYEAVQRIAIGPGSFFLRNFYRSEHIDYLLGQTLVRIIPSDSDPVVFLDDFSNLDLVKSFLLTGAIVVSRNHEELGFEYLSPFINVLTNSLMIAFVQCKFVQRPVDWIDISSKLNKSMKKFKELPDVICFPVVYTTVDQYSITSLNNGVYFTELDVFKYTNKLGILRLHTQKLGQKISNVYPVLEQSSSHRNNSLE
jgi:hypothetical protein